MEFLINFKGIVFMLNKYYSRQNLRLFAQKMFLETGLNMGHPQCFQAITTTKILLQLHEKIAQRLRSLNCYRKYMEL